MHPLWDHRGKWTSICTKIESATPYFEPLYSYTAGISSWKIAYLELVASHVDTTPMLEAKPVRELSWELFSRSQSWKTAKVRFRLIQQTREVGTLRKRKLIFVLLLLLLPTAYRLIACFSSQRCLCLVLWKVVSPSFSRPSNAPMSCR